MHDNCSFFDEYMKMQETRKIKKVLNEKILDSILDDDDEKFIQLVSQIKGTGMNSNKKFKMTQYNIPYLLEYHPTYASLCTLFSAEKCFTSLCARSISCRNISDDVIAWYLSSSGS